MKHLLWTIQDRAAYDIFEKTGVLRADQAHLAFDRDYQLQYSWMAEQMREYLGEPPRGVAYPVWAWYQWEGKRKRMDLCLGGYAPRGMPLVQITFEAEESDFLLSDFDNWNIVLNGQYVADSEQDWDQFYSTEKGNAQKEIVASWDKVFDLQRYNPDWDTPVDQKSIQATLWEIRMEQVKKVEFFLAK